MSAELLTESRALASRIASGDWIPGGIGAIPAPSGSGADIEYTLATLNANGLGWATAQMAPLITWMDGLRSDAGAVSGLAQSLRSTSTQLSDVGDTYVRRLADVEPMSGQTISAYLAHAGRAAERVRVQGEVAGALGVGVQLASQIVSNAYGIVQDAAAEVAAVAVSVHLQTVLAGGIVTPEAMARVASAVAAATTRVGPLVASVVAALGFLGPLLRALVEALKALGKGAGKSASKRTPKSGSGGAKAKESEPKTKEPTRKPLTSEEFDAKIMELKKDAKTTKTTGKPGNKTVQHDLDGDFEQALRTFDELAEGFDVETKENDTIVADLPDGRMLSVRENSKNGKPTLQISDYNSKPRLHIKFRYTQ